jgi:hypothetical protein
MPTHSGIAIIGNRGLSGLSIGLNRAQAHPLAPEHHRRREVDRTATHETERPVAADSPR